MFAAQRAIERVKNPFPFSQRDTRSVVLDAQFRFSVRYTHRKINLAYNFARRLKTLKGLTPYEYVCKIWTKEPERFTINPTQHTVGLNN